MSGSTEKVICASCGWVGRRKPGKLVFCPECGNCATFDVRNKDKKEGRGNERR